MVLDQACLVGIWGMRMCLVYVAVIFSVSLLRVHVFNNTDVILKVVIQELPSMTNCSEISFLASRLIHAGF